MFCFSKVGTDVCSTSLICAGLYFRVLLTELVYEKTHLPYRIADRHIQPAHKQSQDVGLP